MLPLPVIVALSISSCFAAPTLIILAIVGIYAAVIAIERYKYRKIPGPSFNNYFLGNVEQMMEYKMNRHLLWVTWAKEHGDLFRVTFFHKVLLVATSPGMVQEFCSNQEKYSKASFEYKQLGFMCGVRFMGRGLLTETDKSLWRQQRIAVNPAFHKAYLHELTTAFNDVGDRLVEKLRPLANSDTPVCLLDYIGRATLDALCEVAYSFKSHTLEDEKSPFPSALYTVLKMMTDCFRDPFLTLKPWRRKEVANAKKAAKFLRDCGREIIHKRIKSIKLGEETPKDILDIMVRNYSSEISEETLVDEFITLFIAGQETTANSLAFTMSLLGRHPKYLKQIQAEVDSEVADLKLLKWEDVEKLALTESCWKEALRLYPPGYATIREVPEKGCQVKNWWLPGKTSVIVNFVALHYLHNERGDQFYPERFLTGHQSESTCTNIPFSFGQRSCIGRYFANLEAKIFLAKLFQNFSFKVDFNQSFDVDEALTLRLSNGAKFYLKLRT